MPTLSDLIQHAADRLFMPWVLVLLMGGYSAIAGGVALSILMLPTITLTSEDAIRMVPAGTSGSSGRGVSGNLAT